MLRKLLSLFRKKESSIIQTSTSTIKPQRKKIEATRIGEIGEHKINIQLDQLPKECKYLTDLLIPNSKSRSGYSMMLSYRSLSIEK